MGYNVPCNRVAYVQARDFVLTPQSRHVDALGHSRVLNAGLLNELLSHTTRRRDGSMRAGMSEMVPGEAIGPWPAEGVRDDDPNDTIPHENRRELRGERLLAAWVNHWDSREANALDTFVPSVHGGGYVQHWLIDFGDSLGAFTFGMVDQRRLGHAYVVDLPNIGGDFVGLGFVRRPWDRARIDPHAPNLGYFAVANFRPQYWVQQNPMTRFDIAQPDDLAWMARKIARLSPESVRAIAEAAQFTNPVEQQLLVQVLLGRRERILRWSFAEVSPLTDARIVDRERLCVTDLGLATGIDPTANVAYALEARTGSALHHAPISPALERGPRPGELCAPLPPHFAPADVALDDASRYATFDIVRVIDETRTRFRAHLYDLGPQRGYVLAGLER
jgi:hypothetical protein